MSRRGRLVVLAACLATALTLAVSPMGWNALVVLAIWVGSVVVLVNVAVLVDVLWPTKPRISVVQPKWEGSQWARGSVSYRVGAEVDRWMKK